MKKNFFIGLCVMVAIGLCLSGNTEPVLPSGAEVITKTSSAASRLEEITPVRGEKIPLEIKEGLSRPIEMVRMGDVEIRSFLKTIATLGRLNIVATQDVTGRLAMFLGKLENITVGDLLEIVLITNNLAMEIKGNIINVMKTEQFQTIYGRPYNDNRQFKIIKLNHLKPTQVKNLLTQTLAIAEREVINPDDASHSLIVIAFAEKIRRIEEILKTVDVPLETKVFEPRYVRVTFLETLFTRTSTLSPIGEMKVDSRTNKIIITDTIEKLNEISRFITTVDGKPRQVLIEAKMIQIQLNETYYLGVDWQKVFSAQSQWKGLTLVGKYPFPATIQPKPGSTFSATFGTIPTDDFTTTINSLHMFGDLKTISSPRLIALNDTLAKFMVGSREAYVTTTVTTTQGGQSVAENVQFLDVGISLAVTPTINADNFITMHLSPEISAVYDRINTSQGNVVPLVQTTNVNVDIVVKDGVTIVIAGLIKDEKRTTKNGIPLLQDLPLVGPIFRQTGDVQIKTETVIFLTPYIISGDVDDSQFTKQRDMERKEPTGVREIR